MYIENKQNKNKVKLYIKLLLTVTAQTKNNKINSQPYNNTTKLDFIDFEGLGLGAWTNTTKQNPI